MPLFDLAVDEAAELTYTMASGTTTTISDPMTLEGKVLDNNFQTFTKQLSGSGTTLTLTLTAETNGGGEAVAFRDIVVLDGPPSFNYPALSATPNGELNFRRIGGTGEMGELSGSEISAFDPGTDRLFITSDDGLQVLDLSDPVAPVVELTLDPVDFGAKASAITSVAVKNGIVAAGVPAPSAAARGQVIFFDPGNIGAGVPIIHQESFETESGYTLDTAFDAGFSYFGRYVAPDNGNAARDDFQAGFDGDFAIHSQNNSGNNGTATISITGIDISGESDIIVAVALAALNSAPSFDNYEAADNDGIKIYATVDGGTRTLLGEFAPDGDAGDLFLDTNGDGVGDGTLLTTTLADFTFPLGATGNLLDLEIELTTTGSFEPLVVDNVRIQGGTAPTPFLGLADVGALPDMVTFTPDGTKVLVANEGEPVSASMMEGENGFSVAPLFTVGETFTSTTGALNPNTAGDFTPVGILDGLGAYKIDEDTVRVFANHELLNFRGNAYEVSNGSGGTFAMTGARVSYFDIDVTSRQITDAGLAYDTIYDANGAVATDTGFLANNLGGFSRFCSSQLIEAHQFGSGRGLENTIYFTGEEDGGDFNPVGGGMWALDVATGNFWHVPALGRGAWESATEIDTGTTTHVAMLLADDSSPFNADADPEDEAAPMFLYVGEKNGSGDFLEQNGLRGGKLYVWKADNGDLSPLDFRGSGTLQGTWVEVDNSVNLAQASETGDNGFDEFGYPTQSTLWTRAEALGAFQFSRPEDVSTNPADGTEAVLASTGVDTFAVDQTSGNGVDTFGTIYTFKTDFSSITAPTASMTILYDGDADMTRALRSPDNLDWADDGFIYVQEDKAETDTLSGDEVLFGSGAANSNEAGIVRIDPTDGSTLRVANVNRSVIIDPTVADPFSAVDRDAGFAGEWESSGILDVSTLFGEAPGTLFLFDVQAHGIEDQNLFNESSRIVDGDLVEGGQLAFLQVGAPDAYFTVDADGSIRVGQGGVASSPNRNGYSVTVRVTGGGDSVFQNVMIRITSGMVDFTEWLNTIAKAAGKPGNELMGDLNNDGVPNVIDYLFLTSPDAQDIKRNWPKAKKVGADLMVEYTRVKNDDLTWRYQKTRNLTTFEPAVQGVDYTEMVETTGGGSTEKVTLQIFFSGKDPFLIRVEAVENPGVE